MKKIIIRLREKTRCNALSNFLHHSFSLSKIFLKIFKGIYYCFNGFRVWFLGERSSKNVFLKQLLLVVVFNCMLFSVFSQTPVEIHGALSVDGNKIVDKNGDAVSLAGNSLFWSNTGWGGESFYNASVVSWLYENWNTSIIRAAMGVDETGGYISDATNKTKVDTVVKAAINTGIYVIIDWHSHYAENYEDQAITFFKEMAESYGTYDNVIYEIYNEPLNSTSWSNTVKPYAEAVIAAIREIDSDNLIVVGTPTWSQDVDVASIDPITDYSNVAYSLHFYAASHGESLRTKAQTALNNGIALFVTEWGSVSSSGDGDVDEDETALWMEFLCKNYISHCNWALNDKSEGASVLSSGASTTGNWTDDDLTTSGILVKKIISNWSSYCGGTTSGETKLNKTDSKIELYPNPASTKVYININDNDLKILSIDLVRLDGTVDKHIMEIKNEIDISSCSSGIYFVSVNTDRGSIVNRLLIR